MFGRLLAFGSLKGGVGKTTLSMLAAEALHAEGRAVVLIDADIVGTEASEVLMHHADEEIKLCKISLVDVLKRVPDAESVIRWIERDIAGELAQMAHAGVARRFLIQSFPDDCFPPDRRTWREVLERSGLYVQRRMRDLVRACREAGLDVVVDLPAFDVGFAKEARTALAAEPDSRVFYVADCDIRSINATYEHCKEQDPELKKLWLVVNRVPKGKLGADLGFHPNVFIEIPLDEPVGVHTRHHAYGGTEGVGLLDQIAALYQSSRLSDDARRNLRGEQ